MAFYLLLAVFLLIQLFACVHGSSLLPQRISRIESVIDPKLSILTPSSSNNDKRSSLVQHTDSLTLQFTAFDTLFTLHLAPNLDLFHTNATIRIFNDNDNDDDIEETLEPSEFRIFRGHVTSQEQNSWARIILHEYDDTQLVFEGAFMVDSDIYHIRTNTNFRLTRRNDDPIASSSAAMIIYRDSDNAIDPSSSSSSLFDKRAKPFRKHGNNSSSSNDFMCAMEDMEFNQLLTGIRHSNNSLSSATPIDPDHMMMKRAMSMTPNTNGCPSTRRIAYMGVVADCTYVQSYGSIRLARLQILNNWNIASAVYERTFNVSLGLIYIQMSTADCPRHPSHSAAWNQKCSSFYTINDRLSDFSLWRGKRGDDGAALWHLMTKCSTGVKVGIAWLSQLCETQVSQQIEENGASEWVSGTGVSSITRDEWKVVAHEVGHGFGAIHDCTAQTCPCTSSGCSCCPLSDDTCSAGDTYLMNPTSNVTSEDFSPCSISDICGSFPNIGYCLKSPDLRDTTSFTLCGNGILEPGEECDSGLTDSACCHAKNCTLKSGAKCDDYSQQCCLNCTMATAATVCRPAVSECDIPEYCTGESFSCPPDQVEENGSPCGNNTMQCASGVCTSRDEQCIARGMRLGVTEDCSFQHDSCQISCADPTDPGNCLVLSGVFLDGTECGLASFCEKGNCVSTGALNTLKAWVAQNKQIAIPVFLFGSLIIVALLGWLAWFLVRRHRRSRLATAKDKDSRPPSTVHSVVVFGDDGNNDSRARRRHSHTGSSFHDQEQPSSLFQSLHSNARTANDNNTTTTITPSIFATSSPPPSTRQEAWELQPISGNNAVSPLANNNNRSTLYPSKNPYLASTYATKASHLGDPPIAMNTRAAEFSRLGGYTDTSSYLDNPDSVAVALGSGGGSGGSGHRHRRVKSTTT
ncbi:hypothetical protein O0I10_004414 [Lichtheimia ornata]|uniref:Disintegrin and metalloproteinase domain-containing protein B n=1 Tax=Lichtheimia ornata TaxID=688661 RepID=A0AAD7V7B2_9FUNG|nr:uncharacterized protein O0I10_004414 [Lichtheimia ornata]KAJ8659821.1 hypothetical protein O0I10_004414 [Lichtheimia ornata]